LEEGADPERILPVTFTNVAAEDLQREMLRIGVPGCENIRGSTLHSVCMRILSRERVLGAVGRKPRPLNKFEIEPLLYDLSAVFGDKRARSRRIRAYEAAWARLQHETPGYAHNPGDAAFEAALVSWLIFHEGMLIGEIIPYVYRYLRDNPAAPERNLYDFVLVDEYQDLNQASRQSSTCSARPQIYALSVMTINRSTASSLRIQPESANFQLGTKSRLTIK
jgi:superfamily I DNA/RNA helicase